MMWFFAVLIVLAMGGVAAVAAGYGTPLAEEYDDRPDATLPAEGPLTSREVRRVGFTTAWFGYRKSEVDTLLRRLAVEMEEREAASEDDEPRDTPGETPGGSAENSR